MTQCSADPEREFDVLIASDFRHAGPITSSIAQEIERQARVGLCTGLIQVDTPQTTNRLWVHEIRALILAGVAEVVTPQRPSKARLLVLRNPGLFEHGAWTLAARGDRTVMVADRLPRESSQPEPTYSIRTVKMRLAAELGSPPSWAPTSPGTRESLVRLGEHAPALTSTEWREQHRRVVGRVPGAGSAGKGGSPIAQRKKRVLLMSSNGGGMGHLTRLLGIARRLPDDHEAFFLTMSTGVEAIRGQGFWADYLPGPQSGELRQKKWVSYLRERVVCALRDLNPDAFVFDGTFAYRGLTDALDQFPQIHKTWSRRGMWKPVGAARAERARAQAQSFNLIIEPGELAAEVDRGVTTEQRHLLRQLEPMLLLDEGEVLSRPQARLELGIPEDRVAVLLNLGAGNINNIGNLVTAVAEVLRERPDVHVVALQSLIAAVDLPESDRVTKLQTYPLARVLRAFDLCVAAPGYNSFHELLSSAVPTVFIPNEQTALDDQRARAAWAHNAHLARLSHFDDPQSLREALSALLEAGSRQAMRSRLEGLPPCRGAHQAVELIVQRTGSHTRRASGPWRRALQSARQVTTRAAESLVRRLAPRALPGGATRTGLVDGGRVLLIVDRETPPVDTAALIQRHTLDGQPPVLMAHSQALKAFAQYGVTVELLLDHTIESGPLGLDQAAYLDRKIQAVISSYGIGRIVCLGDAVLSRRLAQLLELDGGSTWDGYER